MIQQTINPRAKRLSLRVDNQSGVIKLTIPKWTPKWKINRFLDLHKNWILERQSALLPKIQIQNGAVILFKGVEHKIVIEHHIKRTTEISVDAQSCILTIKTSRPDPTSNLKRWMIDQARQITESLAYQKASQTHKDISKIDLRDTKSRWGSCSTDKRLMLSWRLIMASPDVLDYVIAHEVAHLTHMDHSKEFWDLCYKLTCNNADSSRQWLKENGNHLMQWF